MFSWISLVCSNISYAIVCVVLLEKFKCVLQLLKRFKCLLCFLHHTFYFQFVVFRLTFFSYSCTQLRRSIFTASFHQSICYLGIWIKYYSNISKVIWKKKTVKNECALGCEGAYCFLQLVEKARLVQMFPYLFGVCIISSWIVFFFSYCTHRDFFCCYSPFSLRVSHSIFFLYLRWTPKCRSNNEDIFKFVSLFLCRFFPPAFLI